MFPFDLRGPEFLVFFVIFGVFVLVALHVAQGRVETGPRMAVRLSDPYLIAALTGGKDHLLRVATLSLIDRRLLSVSGDMLETVAQGAEESVRNEVEKQLLRHFRNGREASTVFGDADLEIHAASYEQELATLGLLPDGAVQGGRAVRFFVAMLVLEGVASVKLLVALSQGRTNVAFLITLMIVFAIAGLAISFRRRTRRGDEMLEDLRSLFSGLKDRCSGFRPGESTGEMALLAGVFGMTVLPQAIYPHTKTLYPKASSNSGCGSSCGSSSDSSCGSSCGGGGCGGGCGGCGG